MRLQQKILLTLLAVPIFASAQNDDLTTLATNGLVNSSSVIEYISPDGINAAPHFSSVITTSGQKTVYVSGMTGKFNNNANHLEEYETQLRQAYEKIGIALKAAGATPQDVVRQRVLIVGISQQHAAITRKIMQAFYGAAKPTSTAAGASGLFNPDLVVEVDVTAVLVK